MGHLIPTSDKAYGFFYIFTLRPHSSLHRMNKIIFLSATLLLVFVASCKKDNTIDPNRGRSALHILSASQNKDTFDLNFNYFNVSNTVIGRFYFNRNWPLEGYADLEEGGTADEFGNGRIWMVGTKTSTVFGVPDDTVLKERALILTKDEKSTLCFADSSGEIAVVKFKDEFTVPDTGKTAVRFINLHEAYSATSLLSSNNTNINLAGTAFLGASAFVTVTRGVYSFIVRDDVGTTVIGSSGNVNFEGEGVYTVFFTDDNGTPVVNWFKH